MLYQLCASLSVCMSECFVEDTTNVECMLDLSFVMWIIRHAEKWEMRICVLCRRIGITTEVSHNLDQIIIVHALSLFLFPSLSSSPTAF